MSWKHSTLEGLDEALRDLQKAIDNLPDGTKKKKLQDRFHKLQGVRGNLSHPAPAPDQKFQKHLLLFTGLLLVGFFMLFIILRRDQTHFLRRSS